MAIKTALLCQFRDPEEYFASFHAHHAQIFDWVFYLDHGSNNDYRELDLKNTRIYRTDIRNFTKDLFCTRIIQDIRYGFDVDFLFILDIDEFLPHSDKYSFHDFLREYQSFSVGTLFWRNGYPLGMAPLVDAPPIYVQRKLGETKKLFYNLKRLGQFFPKEGNHNADYSFFGQTRIQLRPIRNKNTAGLIHLPIISKAQLDQKLGVFPSDDFRSKINVPPDFDVIDSNDGALFSVIGNYRAKGLTKYKAQDFEKLSMFCGLQENMRRINSKIFQLPIQTPLPLEEFTVDEVALLRRPGFGRMRDIMSRLSITSDYRLRKGYAS